MAILKLADRREILRRVLEESFKPRFDNIVKQLELIAKELVSKNHPIFLKLISDPDSSKYTAVTRIAKFSLIDTDENTSWAMVSPVYGKVANANKSS